MSANSSGINPTLKTVLITVVAIVIASFLITEIEKLRAKMLAKKVSNLTPPLDMNVELMPTIEA